MMYPNYPYGIFNPIYLNTDQMQRQEVQRQWEQNKNVTDMVKALSDFMDASQKVHPDYRQAAMDACLAQIAIHAMKNNGGQR